MHLSVLPRYKDKSLVMKEQILEPRVDAFISSLRSIGYTLNTAMADVIDNAISAQATTINLYFEAISGDDASFACIDNGCGMNADEMRDAMRLGSFSPDEKRAVSDLGRFGLGLKTASFALCRKLTVVSSINGQRVASCWDLDTLKQTNLWTLKVLQPDDIKALPHIDKLPVTGTMVLWQKIDRIEAKSERKFEALIVNLKQHLALTFHRYLAGEGEKPLAIYVNESLLPTVDPYRMDHFATQCLPLEKVQVNAQDYIEITPYILPSKSKCASEQEYEKYAGEGGYIVNQGFYVYRNKRLISHGTWFRLAKVDNVYQLARVKIDIPNSVDHEWQVDVKKSTVTPPEIVKDRLKRIIDTITECAKRTYNPHLIPIEDESKNKDLWTCYLNGSERELKVNINNSKIQEFRQQLSETEGRKFEILLAALERDLKRKLELVREPLHKQEPLADEVKEQELTVTDEQEDYLIQQGRNDYQTLLCLRGSAQQALSEVLDNEKYKNVKVKLKKVLLGE